MLDSGAFLALVALLEGFYLWGGFMATLDAPCEPGLILSARIRRQRFIIEGS
jgi:hypothetical protein